MIEIRGEIYLTKENLNKLINNHYNYINKLILYFVILYNNINDN